jgi:lipid-A-disaccharide synthase
MGFLEVVKNLRTVKRNFRFCEEDITAFAPDALILIDNSGFNLRIARYVKENLPSIKVYYYILPQAWAWKKKRVHTIHQWTDRIFSILPFEPDFYRSYGYEIDYVGHPIIDALEQKKEKLIPRDEFLNAHGLDDRPLVALLPGSRKQEIKTKLPKMLKVIPHFPNCQFIIAGSETIDKALYEQFTGGQVRIAFGDTYDILNNAEAALVTSGTATLETALFKVPQVVCYFPGWLTFQIARRIVDIKFISMVNIILDKLAVPELIQNEMNEKQMVQELKTLFSEQKRGRILEDYELLRKKLGGVGASRRVAELIAEDIKEENTPS